MEPNNAKIGQKCEKFLREAKRQQNLPKIANKNSKEVPKDRKSCQNMAKDTKSYQKDDKKCPKKCEKIKTICAKK